MMSVKRNPNLGPSHMRQRRRRLFFIRFYIILFLLLVIVITLAIFSSHDKVIVKNIVVVNNAAVTTDDIINIVNIDMAGRYAYLFAKNNYIIFPRFKIKADILKEIKTVKEVKVSWEKWQEISITVEERKPHSVWCGDNMNTEQSGCYFVDRDGYIYNEAPDFSGSMFIKNYGLIQSFNNATSSDPVDQYFLSVNIYQKIYSLINLLAEKNLRVEAVVFDGSDYKFNLNNGIYIIFNNKIDFAQTFGNLFSAMETNNLDLNSDEEKIKYIDLRFENKIVVGKKEI